MSQPARLEERVSDLETEMAEVRFLATKAEREVSDVQTTLRGYTGVLNAIRDDQVEQGKELAKVRAEVKGVRAEVTDVRAEVESVKAEVTDVRAEVGNVRAEVESVRAEVRDGFAKADENFTEVERKFATLRQGQEQITDLLTRHLGEPDEEASAGGADE